MKPGVIPDGSVVLLDTCVWIYHLEDNQEFGPLVAPLLRDMAGGRIRGIMSELSLLEIRVRPLQCGKPEIADEYTLLLDNFPGLAIRPLSRKVVLLAADIRAEYGLRAPDALIVSTGLVNGAAVTVTNDRKWKRVRGAGVICLGDDIGATRA